MTLGAGREASDRGNLVRVLTWNLNVRKDALGQAAAIAAMRPDVAVFQEVIAASWSRLKPLLEAIGLSHTITGLDVLAGAPLSLPRFVAVASRFPIQIGEPADVPAPEVVVSSVLHMPATDVDLIGLHVPTGARDPYLKTLIQEGIASRCRLALSRPHIVCGDFNSPK